MAYMIMYILDHIQQMPQILKAWEDEGAPGITILDSTGVNRLRQAGFRDDLPLVPSLSDLLEDKSIEHKTLLMIVKTEADVDRFVEAARAIVGDFNDHRTGIICVWPLARVYGLDRPIG
ncbi:MAG: hypothetical protein ABI947_19185 [Chloroflexota bacterium]